MNGNMSEYSVNVETLDTTSAEIISVSHKLESKLEEASKLINSTLSDDCFSGTVSDSLKESWSFSEKLTKLDVSTLKNASRLKEYGNSYVSLDKNVSSNISNIEVLK